LIQFFNQFALDEDQDRIDHDEISVYLKRMNIIWNYFKHLVISVLMYLTNTIYLLSSIPLVHPLKCFISSNCSISIEFDESFPHRTSWPKACSLVTTGTDLIACPANIYVDISTDNKKQRISTNRHYKKSLKSHAWNIYLVFFANFGRKSEVSDFQILSNISQPFFINATMYCRSVELCHSHKIS
jgi:hypothetical protein